MRRSDNLLPHNTQPAPGPSRNMSNDDAAILQSLCNEPTQEAFAALCDRQARSAFNLARHITRDTHLAEEAVQETMLSLWNSCSKIRPDNLHGWIMRTVINKSMNLTRGRSRRESAMRRFRESGIKNNTSPTENLQQMEQAEVLTQLKNHVKELSLSDRELIALHFAANLSQAQIARQLDIPQTTVSARVRRVLQFLRGKLTASGLAASLPELGASNIRDAITQNGSVSPEFIKRLKDIPNQAEAKGFFALHRTAVGIALTIVALASAGLAWHETGPLKDPTASYADALLAEKVEQPSSAPQPASVPDSDFEKLYEDDFNRTTLAPFWATASSSTPSKFEAIKRNKSVLVLRATNKSTSPKAKPHELELISKPIDLSGERSLHFRFKILSPRVSGTVEYGTQILNPDGSFIYNRLYRVTRLSKRNEYKVVFLPQPENQASKRPLFANVPPDNTFALKLNPSSVSTSAPPEIMSQFKFKPKGHNGFSVKTLSSQNMGNRVRIRFFIRAYPGSQIEWYLDSAVVYRSTRKLSPGIKSPIHSKYFSQQLNE